MKKNQVHFIGVGGIGVSSLAQYYLAQGWQVSGSDAVKSEITDDLKKRGIKVFTSPGLARLEQVGLVIYSAAIKSDHPELVEAKKLGIKTQLYSEAVGELTQKYFTIAVSGSHGKSTTTALIGLIMAKAGLDPTIIIGTKLKEFSGNPSTSLDGTRDKSLGAGNFRLGHSRYLVLEADEYARSFHNYFPKIAVLTNIDKEHLDIYKNLNGVLAGFKKYLGNVSADGFIIANAEDVNIRKVIKFEARNPKSEMVRPLRQAQGKQAHHPEQSRGTNYKSQKINPKIIWYKKGEHKLSIPGDHNQFNAEAAWQAVKLLGVKRNVAEKIFKSYQGAWRRLERLQAKSYKLKAVIYSDYAHHPTEIKATLQALKQKYPKKKLICIFQPHQQDRLNRLFKDFITAFNAADKVILYPLYKVKGRDPSTSLDRTRDKSLRTSTDGKSSADLARAIHKPNVFYAEDFKSVISFIESDLKSNTVIVFMSAGDLDDKVKGYLSN